MTDSEKVAELEATLARIVHSYSLPHAHRPASFKSEMKHAEFVLRSVRDK